MKLIVNSKDKAGKSLLIMIVDNCPAHLEITGLKAIDLQFLSPKVPRPIRKRWTDKVVTEYI